MPIPFESPIATVAPKALKSPIRDGAPPAIDVRKLSDYQLRSLIARCINEQKRRAQKKQKKSPVNSAGDFYFYITRAVFGQSVRRWLAGASHSKATGISPKVSLAKIF